MSSSTGSTTRRPEVKRIALITHGRAGTIGGALERLRALADARGVELLLPDEEVAKHGDGAAGAVEDADLAIVLGGDGTMLRALGRFRGTGVPTVGVNYGRVGFLTAIPADDLEDGLRRVFAGDYRTIELSTLEVTVNGATRTAVNDVVVAGGTLGRMIEVGYAIGGEELGSQPCDGLICATPAGSTAYNLSNGGPVLVWGLDAMVLTFVAPHALHIRPLVVPRGPDVVVTNVTTGVETSVLVDGQQIATLGSREQAVVRVGAQPSLLGTLPEVTFFSRYAANFGR